jgi:catechol 2,3-dioxygenase-like lactoylglutathione lyase family enzyme
MITGLDHVQIAAPPGSEDAAREFYGDALGLAEIPKPAPLLASGGVWFACGPQELHIGIEEPFAPARKAHPGLVSDDLDALAGRLGDVQWDDRLAGVRRFYVNDPFGNRLEIRAR